MRAIVLAVAMCAVAGCGGADEDESEPDARPYVTCHARLPDECEFYPGGAVDFYQVTPQCGPCSTNTNSCNCIDEIDNVCTRFEPWVAGTAPIPDSVGCDRW